MSSSYHLLSVCERVCQCEREGCVGVNERGVSV